MRCLRFFVRGFFGIRPWPYHRDGQCWLRGRLSGAWALISAIPVLLIGAGFVLGRLALLVVALLLAAETAEATTITCRGFAFFYAELECELPTPPASAGAT